MKLNIYEKLIINFFFNNETIIKKMIIEVLKNYYSIPINECDLFQFILFEFFSIEYEIIYYKIRIPIEKFIMSRIKYVAHNCCKKYTKKSEIIMNNYVSYDIEENNIIKLLSCSEDYYIPTSVFSFLTQEEFDLIYTIKVTKAKRKTIAKEWNISLVDLNEKEYAIMNKIKLYFSQV